MNGEMTGIRWLAQAERPNRKILSLRGRSGFEQLATQWDQLISRLVKVRFYQHPDWYRALFDSALADPEESLFVTVSDGPDLVGLFPFQISNLCTMGATINTIGLCYNPQHMLLADCIIDDSQECAWMVSSLAGWLHEACPVAWDVMLLDKVPQRSASYRLLSAEPASRVVPNITGSCSYVPTDGEDAALGPVSGSFKRNLRRLAKRAEETAPLRYEVCETLSELDRAFEQLLVVEASGWKGDCGTCTAIAQDAKQVGFYRELMWRFGERGQCKINQLIHGDKVVASQFGLMVGGTFSILKIGYSEEHAWFAPGNLAMERTIRWCCTHPDVRELSFVTCPSWSHLWKANQEAVASFRIFNPTLKGHLLQSGLRTKRWYDKWRRHKNVSERGTDQSPTDAPEESGADQPGAPAAPLHAGKAGKS
jgi:CelD/BcsL family acetyltransferase involved in cellulose biosynthesis